MDDVDEEEDEAPAAEEAPRVEMESESGGEKDRESAPSGERPPTPPLACPSNTKTLPFPSGEREKTNNIVTIKLRSFLNNLRNYVEAMKHKSVH